MTLSDQELAELKNIINVKDVIRRSENPNPLIIVLIILGSMILMYFIFVQFVKKSVAGTWLDDNKNINIINHNKWKDSISINDNSNGFVKGHMIIVYMFDKVKTGIWLNDKINWTDGSSWQFISE